MKIEPHLALPYQKSLIFAALEYFSASDLLGDVCGGQFGDDLSAWKSAAINFLHRNLFTKLIALNANAFEEGKNFKEDEVVGVFSSSDPNKSPEIWMGIQFQGTEKLSLLVASHGMLNWDCIQSPLNHDFINAVSEIYTDFGL